MFKKFKYLDNAALSDNFVRINWKSNNIENGFRINPKLCSFQAFFAVMTKIFFIASCRIVFFGSSQK